jgi:anti-sigma B factor antagonist/stage II sporulation protein AA (anti-sigma F factor antagonist)
VLVTEQFTMAFELGQVGGVHVARLHGRLDSANSPELERSLRDITEAGGARLLFDLSGLDYISSAGLRVLLLAAKKLRAAQPAGRLAMAGVHGHVHEVFEMSGFLTLFPVADSVDAALAQLQA